MKFFKRLYHDQSAASAAEYGILVAVLAVAVGFGVNFFGGQLQNMFKTASQQMNAAPTAGAGGQGLTGGGAGFNNAPQVNGAGGVPNPYLANPNGIGR